MAAPVLNTSPEDCAQPYLQGWAAGVQAVPLHDHPIYAQRAYVDQTFSPLSHTHPSATHTHTEYASVARQILAGNGLTGGGALSADRTVNLRTPLDITTTSSNSEGTPTLGHTHNILSSANPGRGPAVLQTDDLGNLILHGLQVETLNGLPIDDIIIPAKPDLTGYARLDKVQTFSAAQTAVAGLSVVGGLLVDTINGHPISDFLDGGGGGGVGTPGDLTGYARLDADQAWTARQVFANGIDTTSITGISLDRFARRDQANDFQQAVSIVNGLTVDTINGHPISDFLESGPGTVPAGVVLQDGTRPLTANWNIGLGKRIKAQYIDAIDATGLNISDKAGNIALFVKDGGFVGVKNKNPQGALHVTGTFYLEGNQTVNKVDPAVSLTPTSGKAAINLGSADAGASWGAAVSIGRNSNTATPAAGVIQMFMQTGATRNLWFDKNGRLRFGTGLPTFAGDLTGELVATLQASNVFTAAQRIDVSGGALMLASAAAGQHTYLAFFPDSFANGRKGYVGFGGNTSKVLSIINEWNDPASAINIMTVGSNQPIQFGTNSSERARVTNIGLGISGGSPGFNPQGPLHVHDGVGGKIFATKTAVTTAVQIIIPNGAGDVTRGFTGQFIVWDGVMTALSPNVTLAHGVQTSLPLQTSGANIYVLRLNADGSLDVRRSAGTLSATVVVSGIWI